MAKKRPQTKARPEVGDMVITRMGPGKPVETRVLEVSGYRDTHTPTSGATKDRWWCVLQHGERRVLGTVWVFEEGAVAYGVVEP